MSHSQNQLKELARENPKQLARILSSPNADVVTLTYGAELLGGEISDEDIVLPVLRLLLKHINAVVREGAIIGLSSFYINKSPPRDILDRLRILSKQDPSPTIKEYAKSVLDDFLSME
jgi:hypothetical protein